MGRTKVLEGAKEKNSLSPIVAVFVYILYPTPETSKITDFGSWPIIVPLRCPIIFHIILYLQNLDYSIVSGLCQSPNRRKKLCGTLKERGDLTLSKKSL